MGIDENKVEEAVGKVFGDPRGSAKSSGVTRMACR
jgi:hypothetical protein